ncbi:MAG: DUF1289 domain-containing protein [Pseudomonadales bacterium]|nr:DUF1289 domain-containing protein [Pseudomonadales bacterium]
MNKTYVKSPCIMVCHLDENKICEGCFRTEKEIEEWNSLNDGKKSEVLKKTYRRYNRMRKAGLAE